MSFRNGPALLGAAALVLALAAPVGAQEPTVETVADGLAAPRGIAIAPNGALYVAEAGSAGDECMGEGQEQMCWGLSGGVTRIRPNGNARRIVDGLPSMGAGPEVGGVSDVALGPDDAIALVMNLGADPAEREDLPADVAFYAGRLVRGVLGAGMEPAADIAAFEASEDPDGAFGGIVDSNPYALTFVADGLLVVDAGGNSLLHVDDAGSVSLVAVFPAREVLFPAEMLGAMGGVPEEEGGLTDEGAAPVESGAPVESAAPAEGTVPAEGEMVPLPVESVPTSVVVGPDGAYYVGELTGGPFPVGEARVWRVTPDGEVSEYASGFTNIIDIAFGPDGTLYVAEIVHEGLMGVFTAGAAPVGAILRVPPGGGEPELLISDERVMAPGGIAVSDDGAIYVSTGTIVPDAGAVIKITP